MVLSRRRVNRLSALRGSRRLEQSTVPKIVSATVFKLRCRFLGRHNPLNRFRIEREPISSMPRRRSGVPGGALHGAPEGVLSDPPGGVRAALQRLGDARTLPAHARGAAPDGGGDPRSLGAQQGGNDHGQSTAGSGLAGRLRPRWRLPLPRERRRASSLDHD